MTERRRYRQSTDKCVAWAQTEHAQFGEKARSEGAQRELGEMKLLLQVAVGAEELWTFL